MAKKIKKATLVARSIDYVGKTTKSLVSHVDEALAVYRLGQQLNSELAESNEVFPLEEINREKTGLSYGLTQDYDTYQNKRNDVKIGCPNGFCDEDEIDFFEVSFR